MMRRRSSPGNAASVRRRQFHRDAHPLQVAAPVRPGGCRCCTSARGRARRRCRTRLRPTVWRRARPSELSLGARLGRASSCPGRAPGRRSHRRDCARLSTRRPGGPARPSRSGRCPNRFRGGDCRDRGTRRRAGSRRGGGPRNRSSTPCRRRWSRARTTSSRVATSKAR